MVKKKKSAIPPDAIKRVQREIPAILIGKKRKVLVFRAADGKLDARFQADRSKEKTEIGDLALLKPGKRINRSVWLARVVAWLGPADRVAAQEAIVKHTRQAPGAFPKPALEQANALAEKPVEIAGREDLRDLNFVTIDGPDARDFDDAIQVETVPGGFVLRVAIADVSHYVLPDEQPASLDMEARARGNSWYFPASVEPMLPKILSNGLCSLRPDEDRLAMLVEMPFTKSGDPLAPRFAAIVMRSAGRLIYGDVAKFFNGDQNAVARADLREMLGDARALYEMLARKRRERGSLDFQMPEAAYEFDRDGRLLAMRQADVTDANRLIEEFMIAANEAVAGFLAAKGAAFLYRVHPAPEPEKLESLFETLKNIAPEVLPPESLRAGALAPADIQKILVKAAGTNAEYSVNRLCLRSMGQARCQPQNIGHFGLASAAYCHFTSPIRRYADLLTHRALKACIGAAQEKLPDADELARICDELNALERRAVECERDMARRMACLALMGREGEVFSGTVSGVADFGVFVELDDLPAEGLMRARELGNEWFELDQARQRLMGQAGGRVWRLGQPVKCVLAGVNPAKQAIALKPCGITQKRLAKSGFRQRRKPERLSRRRSSFRKQAD